MSVLISVTIGAVLFQLTVQGSSDALEIELPK
jgi:hypothetical protein